MDEIEIPEIPEDLAELTDEQLAELGTAIGEAASALAEADVTDEVIEAIEALAAGADRVDTEAADREEAASELQSRREAALSRFVGPDGDDEVEDAEDGEVEEAELADETAEPEGADDVELEVEEPAEAGTETDETVEEPEAVAASAKRPAKGSLATIKRSRPAATPPAGEVQGDFRTEFQVNGGGHGSPATLTDRRELGAQLLKRAGSFGQVPSGVSEPVSVATASWNHKFQVSADPVENMSVFRAAIDAKAQALVASGPAETPLDPLRDFFRLAEPQTPIEDAIPTVGAQRGGVRFIPGNCSRTAGDAAITTQDSATNTDPDNPDLKNVLHVPTATVDEAFVTAVSSIIEFDNLGHRTFPEQVANFTEDVAVSFAATKEILYLDQINAEATAITGIDTGYGITRQILWNYATAATNYRQRQGMRRDALLQAILPSWVCDAIILDLKLATEDANFQATSAMVDDMFRRIGIAVTWHNDNTTGGSERFGAAQGAGAMNAWPALAFGYLFATGEWVRMDGGTLDIGVVRDSTLNRRNDLQIFMEEWTGLVHYGCETLRLQVPVAVNGTGADAVTPYSPA